MNKLPVSLVFYGLETCVKKYTGSRWGGMSYIVRLDWKIVTCAIFLAKGFSNSEIIAILALKNWHTCHYIQSALAIPNKEKEEQELQSLVNINDSFKKIVVVNGNIKPWRNEKGILFIGLMDFLLDKTSLEYWIDGLNPAVEHDRDYLTTLVGVTYKELPEPRL